MILAKFVLVNIAVYWFYLCKVPKSIINEIQKKIMSSKWSSIPQKNKYHLLRWEIVARPVEKGGCGLKNMHIVSLGLNNFIPGI